MKINKKIILPIIVLTCICIVVAVLMGLVNMITAPRIAANALKKEQAALFEVFPTEEDGFDEVKNLEGLPQTVKTVYKAKGGAGFAISVATRSNYSSGDMTFVVGIDNDGKIVGITLNSYNESKDFGKDYPQNFVGKNADDYANVETVTGVTSSSTAFKSAIGDAISSVKIAQGVDVPAPEEPENPSPEEPQNPSPARDEEEVISLAGELVAGAKGFTKLELGGEDKNLVSLYRENSGNGYVAYVLVVSENYGTVESEAIIHIGMDGTVKGLNKLTWKTSDAMYGYVPPTEETVNAFYDRLSGVSTSTIDSVELVTNATNTSTNVVKSFKEALAAADAAIKKDMPTPEAELLSLANTLIGNDAGFESLALENNTYLKRLFRNNGGKGYVAYVVVISANYGTVESEALIHIGTDGTGKGLNKLTWKTSDAMYGYVPPTEETVNAFYDRLSGANSSTIDSVELVTNATNTSTNVVKSFKEALVAADEAIKNDMPTSESDLLAFAGTLVGDESGFEPLTISNTTYLKRLYKNNGGKGYVAYVVVISANYGTVESEALIHIGNDGKIKGINKLTWKTSDAIYGYVPPTEETVNAFYDRLSGVSSSTIDSVELVTNATNTSTNVVKSFKEALAAAEAEIAKDLPTPESELFELADTLMGTSANFENVTPDGNQYLKRLYKDKGGNGYIAYIVVISANYGTVESEALIYIGNDGIIKGLNKLTWKTSDAMYGYVPPTAEEVDAFYSRLSGASSSTIDAVELVTNATNTSTNVINSFKEALAAADEAIKKDMPTPESELLELAGVLVGNDEGFESIPLENNKYLRRLYKNKGGKGYVAYVVVISANYGTVESEALIYIGNDGKIKGLNKLTWKTSDAIYGYVPPSAEDVDAFYNRLSGTSSSTIDSVELVTNATNTSTNVINSFKEALAAADAVRANEKSIAPRVIGITVLIVAIGSFAAFFVYNRKRRAPYEK